MNFILLLILFLILVIIIVIVFTYKYIYKGGEVCVGDVCTINDTKYACEKFKDKQSINWANQSYFLITDNKIVQQIIKVPKHEDISKFWTKDREKEITNNQT